MKNNNRMLRLSLTLPITLALVQLSGSSAFGQDALEMVPYEYCRVQMERYCKKLSPAVSRVVRSGREAKNIDYVLHWNIKPPKVRRGADGGLVISGQVSFRNVLRRDEQYHYDIRIDQEGRVVSFEDRVGSEPRRIELNMQRPWPNGGGEDSKLRPLRLGPVSYEQRNLRTPFWRHYAQDIAWMVAYFVKYPSSRRRDFRN